MQYCTRNPAIKKPELSDASSIIDINDNMDVIDGIICKSNYNGGIDPGVNDDIGDGYSVGSHWWNVTDHRLFVAESVATGAAVWRQIYPTIDALMPDGSVPLSANWDAGAYEIRAQTFESDQATGTAPLVVASTTKVTNLNADKLDGLDDTAFLKHSLATAANDFLVASGTGSFVKKTLAETQAILDIAGYRNSLYVTVGPTGCDYTTDGIDDAVQIQEAIDYCAGAVGRPRTVVLLNQEYNLGNYVITLHRDIELRGMISSRVAADGGSWSSGKCTTLNVTSTTYNAVVMHSGSALRYLRFDYPNQSAASVITYPATITDDVDIVSGSISGIIVEDIVGCMPYNFIDFSTSVTSTRVDYTINRIRGDPLKYGISLDKCVHLMTVSDAQFVPGFGGRIVPNHGTLLNYMMNNLRAFYSNRNDGGYFQNCIVWCSKQAFVVGESGIGLFNCMGDASYEPLHIASSFTTSVVGGYFVAFAVNWDGENYNTLYPENIVACRITGEHNCLHGVRFVSSEGCVDITPAAKDTVVSGCLINNVTTSGEDVDWIAIISDFGKRSSITGNTICSPDVSSTNIVGIIVVGEDSVYSGNVFQRGVFSYNLGDYLIYDTEVRCVVEGISRNNGDPNSTGNWYGKRRPGVIVHDYTNDKRYIDVSAYGQTPSWKEI